ncbi:Oidioi.mRNA.OKI2018_I69.PAR.g9549.t1.cds [Oikopleura dioica]|uniref:Oidioi.mRNA.OKI2018_I69.PAR.g9549.t1.cds n=1 Tax=Oikopleura dioica TaxID=34765 RepID=A0ABN7RPS6_OIKDI|nr:Oidioi.mRNA.OKI2018_I69.PAR.g9549.t1.cds [Oikopleura dioica]
MTSKAFPCYSLIQQFGCTKNSIISECQNLKLLCENENISTYDRRFGSQKLKNVYEDSNSQDTIQEIRFIFLKSEETTPSSIESATPLEIHLPGFDGYMITIIFVLIIFIIVVWSSFKKSRKPPTDPSFKPEALV